MINKLNSYSERCKRKQWCNSYGLRVGKPSGVTGGGQGGRVPSVTSDWEIFADVSGKKRQGKKGKGVKIEKKRRKIVKGKNCKREGGNLKKEGGKVTK